MKGWFSTSSPKSPTGTEKGKSPAQPTKGQDRPEGQKPMVAMKLSPLNKVPKNEQFYDTFCFFVYCHTHKKLAISSVKHNNGVIRWLPYSYFSYRDESWESVITEGVPLILAGNDSKLKEELATKQPFDWSFFEMFRLQLPQTLQVLFRMTSLVVLKAGDPSIPRKVCPEHTGQGNIEWVNVEDVLNGKIQFWGSEVLINCRKLPKWEADPEDEDQYFDLEEFFVDDDVFLYVARDQSKNLEEEMLKLLKVSEQDVERVFIDFLEHLFPAFFMTKTSFANYMVKYGVEMDDRKLNSLFNAFNYRSNGCISFHELLLGIAAIDPRTPPIGSRFKFIFRYYDTDRNGYLNENEFRAIVQDINGPDTSEEVILQKTKEGMAMMKATNKGVPYDGFYEAIKAFTFRGTSSLCRLKSQLFSAISKALIDKTDKTKPELKKAIIEVVSEKKYEGDCGHCQRLEYEVAPHVVVLNTNGKIVAVNEIKESKTPFKDIDDSNAFFSVVETLPQQSANKNKYYSSYKYASEVVFNEKSVANELIAKIRAFVLVKGNKDNPRGLMDESGQREKLCKLVQALADKVTPILEAEPRCLKVESPVVVIGDIHGNIEDLFTIEYSLFRSFPIVDSNYLFLGDYVDRGKWSVECVLYILCLKVICPNNFFLLRGNHETRQLQEIYGFHEECRTKYGPTFGDQIWERLNKVFDRLPLAAVVDDEVFCCHGGIPSTEPSIKEIDKIKNNLDVTPDSVTAWELLWNDPVDDDRFRHTADLLDLDNRDPKVNKGFVANTRRGTGYFFNSIATHNFLKFNGLTHVVRAHEVPMNGFALWYDGQLVTIFTHSHYVGVDNKAAVLQLVDGKLQVLVLDTENNAPATDLQQQKPRHKH